MGRHRGSTLDLLASLPWTVGVVAGMALWLAIRYGPSLWFGAHDGEVSEALARGFASGVLDPLAWLVLVACWSAALVSFVGARRRRRLLDVQTGLESFAAMGWREFEQLVGEAYRRDGYAVEETGQGGADGGVDLILRKNGRTVLVQVKQWRRQRVDVRVVREMYGLMAHHRADAVRIAALGGFTPDARRFAENKSIELMDASELWALVASVQSQAVAQPDVETRPPRETPASSTPPICPKCASSMKQRTNRTTGQAFWGCSRYPNCKGTRIS